MKRTIFWVVILILVFVVIFFQFKEFYFKPESAAFENVDDFEVGEYEIEVLVSDLDTVWGIDFLPDGKMIFTEREGNVNIYDGSVVKIGEVDVSEVSESGLAGVAVDPDFYDNGFVYLYYASHDSGNRVSRFFLDLEESFLSDETILLDNIPSARFHDGGRIKFGPDGHLYVTTGDATNPEDAQNLDSLAGKILRIGKNGEIPEYNPFGNYVYSYGHRNPQGIAFYFGDIYASEHGPNRNDEINLIRKGENYGWPLSCSEQNLDSVAPIRCYTEFTLAPSGMDFYNGELYVAGLRGSQVRKLTLNEGGVVSEKVVFDYLGRVREVVSYNDWLYIGTSNRDGRGNVRKGDDKILRVRKK